MDDLEKKMETFFQDFFFQEMICLCQEFSLGKSPNVAFPLA